MFTDICWWKVIKREKKNPLGLPYNIMFPVRHGLTVGSAEFEKVMQCFKIENKVDETKNSTTKRHKFQGQQDDEIDVSIDVKQRDAERTTGDLNTTFKSLSLGNGGSSTGIKTPAPRNWSYSTAITSSEKLRKTEQRFRRNSAPISAKKAFPSSNNERFGKASLSSGYSTASPAAPIRNRRASLPSLRGSYPGPVMSSGNSTEKVKSFLHDYVRPNLNVKLPEVSENQELIVTSQSVNFKFARFFRS